MVPGEAPFLSFWDSSKPDRLRLLPFEFDEQALGAVASGIIRVETKSREAIALSYKKKGLAEQKHKHKPRPKRKRRI